MPTHRMWLHAIDACSEATIKEKEEFRKSEYYQAYSALLSDSRLLNIVHEYGYQIVFYPHYAQQSFISCFAEFSNNNVCIANRLDYDVQTLLLESTLLVTDYSSVFFDFAFMGKPQIYYQFDE